MTDFSPDFRKPTILFGGSFDPLHLGHLELARGALAAVAQLVPDPQIVFVPAFLSPGKAAAKASPEARLELLRVGLANTPYEIWDFELRRPGPSYTIETLREAQRRGATSDRLFLLVGSDAYTDMPQWKESGKIREYVRLLVGNRPGHPVKTMHADDSVIPIQPLPLASQEIRRALENGVVPEDALPAQLAEELRRLSLNSRNPYAK